MEKSEGLSFATRRVGEIVELKYRDKAIESGKSILDVERDEIIDNLNGLYDENYYLFRQKFEEEVGDLEMIDETYLESLINRRQRQILVHSIIYYKYNANLISDSTWTKWAVELEELQKQYPHIAASQYYGEYFKGFDHSTGYSLPLDDPKANSVARRLMDLAKNCGFTRKLQAPL